MFKVGLVVAFAFFALACSEKTHRLETAVEGYHNALRWSDLNRALEYVSPNHRAEFYKNGKPLLKGSRILDFSVSGVMPRESKSDEFTAIVVMQYFHPELGVEQSVEVAERWIYDPELKHWFLESTSPFGSVSFPNRQ